MDQKTEDRFWKKVNKKDTGCWYWTGCVNLLGYGVFGVKRGMTRVAHRISYQLKYRKISEEEHVLHTCKNRKCVNPGHLYLKETKGGNSE